MSVLSTVNVVPSREVETLMLAPKSVGCDVSVTTILKKLCGFNMSTMNHMPGIWPVPLVQWVFRFPSIALDGTLDALFSVADAVAIQPVVGSGISEVTQRWLVHVLVTQSAATAQVSAIWHLLGQPAPQSTVGSVPFSTPSLHVGAVHRCVVKVHTELAQSVATRQAARGAHPVQLPPQSTSVSLPLRTPSVQLVGWQVPFEQLAWSQSVFATQCSVTAQRVQPLLVPPQSRSVSSWFSRPSEHDGERHLPPVHSATLQSTDVAQLLPVAHGLQVPPQSTSDSV
jgi:hypothetical protein